MIIINICESFNHKTAKELVFDWLINGKTKIPDNTEPIEWAEFGCCEAITFKWDDKDGKLPYHYGGYCDIFCNKRKVAYKNFYNAIEKSIKENNLLLYKEKYRAFYKESPCKTCPIFM